MPVSISFSKCNKNLNKAKFTILGRAKHFQSTWVRRVMPIFVTLIGWNPRCASHKTAGTADAVLILITQSIPSVKIPPPPPHVITFCPIRLSKLSWAFMNYSLLITGLLHRKNIASPWRNVFAHQVRPSHYAGQTLMGDLLRDLTEIPRAMEGGRKDNI